MATTYVGRHNPRRHVGVAGLIASPERYDRYYDIAWEALQGDRFPLTTLPADDASRRTPAFSQAGP
jgi:hypothetical protein